MRIVFQYLFEKLIIIMVTVAPWLYGPQAFTPKDCEVHMKRYHDFVMNINFDHHYRKESEATWQIFSVQCWNYYQCLEKTNRLQLLDRTRELCQTFKVLPDNVYECWDKLQDAEPMLNLTAHSCIIGTDISEKSGKICAMLLDEKLCYRSIVLETCGAGYAEEFDKSLGRLMNHACR